MTDGPGGLGGDGRAEVLVAQPQGGPAGQPESPQHKKTPLWVLKATQLLGAAAFACFGRYISVYFSEIGLTRTQIGLLGFISPMTSFAGQLAWGALIDWLGEYKSTLVLTQLFGTGTVFLYMLPQVQHSFPLVMIVTLFWNFLLSTGGPIIDAMCLTVLAEQSDTNEVYGDQRLWCAIGWGGMALFAGQLIDVLGLDFMFIGFAAIQSINIGICVVWLPQPKKSAAASDSAAIGAAGEAAVEGGDCGGGGAAAGGSPAGGSGADGRGEPQLKLLSFEVIWFFANLIQYGAAMSLIESFLFVWLLQDFQGTTKFLLGVATLVMCIFEVPVFKYIGKVWAGGTSLTSVLFVCQVMLVLRCWLYTLLPSHLPALVLIVEPLHGICFAAMWAATVEYGQRLAPPGAVARMQALVNGLYYNVSMGVGAVFWGIMVEPNVLGFTRSFYLDAVFITVWAVIWHLGLFLHARYRRRQEGRAREAAIFGASATARSGLVANRDNAVAAA